MTPQQQTIRQVYKALARLLARRVKATNGKVNGKP